MIQDIVNAVVLALVAVVPVLAWRGFRVRVKSRDIEIDVQTGDRKHDK